jgi:hypothetical protein
MAEESFKERARQEMIKAAKQYKDIYVDYEYLICSVTFEKNNYYIIAAEEDNFQHLTGVHSNIDAKTFFHKCYDGTLEEEDFDFTKAGQNEKSAKGTVRRKIQVLPDMMTLMKSDVQVEEGFRKNRVVCSLATADGNCTLGFSESMKARPKSLIKGNELKNPGTVDLILRKIAGSSFFDEIVVGDIETLNQFREKIENIVSAQLFEDAAGE